MKIYSFFMSLLVLASLLLLEACDLFKKSDPKPLSEIQKLPPATQTGKNTMGCLINGKAMVPPTTVDLGAVYQQGILQITGGADNPRQGIAVVIYEINYGLLSTTSYQLNKFPDSYSEASFQKTASSLCIYGDKSTFAGFVSITKIDRTNYIVSGTFEFSTVTSGCDTLKITNGRFDIKYIP